MVTKGRNEGLQCAVLPAGSGYKCVRNVKALVRWFLPNCRLVLVSVLSTFKVSKATVGSEGRCSLCTFCFLMFCYLKCRVTEGEKGKERKTL